MTEERIVKIEKQLIMHEFQMRELVRKYNEKIDSQQKHIDELQDGEKKLWYEDRRRDRKNHERHVEHQEAHAKQVEKFLALICKALEK